MHKYLSKTINILKDNMIFIQPLLLFLLISMLLTEYIIASRVTTIHRIIMIISSLLLTVVFTAGWMYINKLGVIEYSETDSGEEKTRKTLKNLKKFFEGAAIGFTKILTGSIILLVIYIAAVYLLYRLCLHFYTEPKMLYELQNFSSMTTPNEINEFLSKISSNDKLVFVKWVATGYFAGLLMQFGTILYFTSLVFDQKNIFSSLWRTIKFFFKNILECLFIIVYMSIIYFLVNLITLPLGSNTFTLAAYIILLTLYLNYYVLLVFCFYYEQTKNNSTDGVERVG